MVFISAEAGGRLDEVAKRELGPRGDHLLHETVQEHFGVPFARLSYAQFPKLLKAVQADAAALVGVEPAQLLAADLVELHRTAEAGFTGRIVAATAKRMGDAAEPFLDTVCARLGVLLPTVDKGTLSLLAEAVQESAQTLLGAETARALGAALLEAGNGRLADLPGQVSGLATARLGNSGEMIIRRLCRERMEIELDDVTVEAVRPLAAVVERDGAAMVGAVRVAPFVQAAQLAILSPTDSLRRKVGELTTRRMGPAGGDFVKEACARNGLPYQCLDYEHLMWFAEVLRAVAMPLMGKKGADELARDIRELLTGGR